MEEFAHNLIALWDEYLATDWNPHHHTMTDFMMWVRRKYASQETDSSVNEGANTTAKTLRATAGADPARWTFDEPDKAKGPVEPSVAKSALEAQLTRDKVKEVRRLYEKGYSLARIRQKLNLDVTLTRLQTAVNKPW